MKKLGFILIIGVVSSCSETLDGLKEQRKTLKKEFKEYSKEYYELMFKERLLENGVQEKHKH